MEWKDLERAIAIILALLVLSEGFSLLFLALLLLSQVFFFVLGHSCKSL
jgi:hypothetical protein